MGGNENLIRKFDGTGNTMSNVKDGNENCYKNPFMYIGVARGALDAHATPGRGK